MVIYCIIRKLPFVCPLFAIKSLKYVTIVIQTSTFKEENSSLDSTMLISAKNWFINGRNKFLGLTFLLSHIKDLHNIQGSCFFAKYFHFNWHLTELYVLCSCVGTSFNQNNSDFFIPPDLLTKYTCLGITNYTCRKEKQLLNLVFI